MPFHIGNDICFLCFVEWCEVVVALWYYWHYDVHVCSITCFVCFVEWCETGFHLMEGYEDGLEVLHFVSVVCLL